MNRLLVKLLLSLSLLTISQSLCFAQDLTNNCSKKRGVSFAGSFEELGNSEAIDVQSACSSIFLKKKALEVPAAIKNVKSVKNVSKANFNSCVELSSTGLKETAALYCSVAYMSKWEAICCEISSTVQ